MKRMLKQQRQQKKRYAIFDLISLSEILEWILLLKYQIILFSNQEIVLLVVFVIQFDINLKI